MLFNSISYLIFAPFVIFIYFLLPQKFNRIWLLIVSIYFYGVFKWIYVLLLLYSIFISYISISLITTYRNQTQLKKLFLWIGLVGNLLLLGVFKYLEQIFDIINLILGNRLCDISYIEAPTILLPMGVSFFVLQAISAIIDVYKEKEEPPKNLFYFALYLSFFPQLVAGPILRMQDLIKQFYSKTTLTKENFRYGLFLITLGFFKKTLIADQISPYVDQVFQQPWEYHSLSMWFAVFLFSLQIYGDFSGYSDIAIGTAKILGFHLPLNFRRPFFSTSMREFWNRWHISFSSWLRDYIYIPLGGSRVSPLRVYINLFITMLISGIWHGAGWNYLLWGGLHGFFLLLERYITSFSFIKWDKLPRIIGVIYSFWVFSFTFFFFRSKPLIFPGADFYTSSIEVGWYMVLRAFIYSPGKIIFLDLRYCLMIITLFTFEYYLEKIENKKLQTNNLLERFVQSLYLYVFVIVVMFTSFVIYNTTVSQPFVYFQF